MPVKSRVISIAVAPEGKPLYDDMTTTVTIVDEAAGEFVEVDQHGAEGRGKIAIDPSEWPEIKAAIDRMIAECRTSP